MLEAKMCVGYKSLKRLATDFRFMVKTFMEEWQAEQTVFGEIEADEAGIRKVR